ncbi:MAG: M28 family metallopeptidase [Solirubrobacterales bacterium]
MALAGAALGGCGGDASDPDRFDGERAFELIETQVRYGPRPAGSETLERLGRKLRRQLPNAEVQPLSGGLLNLISVIPGNEPAVLVAAHYDTEATVPDHVGANDGAAGTAAVVELARTVEDHLPEDHREVRFALFDGEEEPPGCPDARFERCALRGSKAYAAAHSGEIGELILLDYVANRGLRLTREGNSDPALWAELRESAETVGAEEFFPEGQQAAIIDDHVPFIRAGVPAIDLIDFSYPFADTARDTPDKLDPEALDAVGETVAELIIRLSSSS